METTTQAKPTSRLAQMQIRFQQKQQLVREQKKSEIIANNVAVRPLAAIDMSDGKMLASTLGAGKVRQMFDERRQKTITAGIDKSYPLQPLAANTRKSPMIAKRTAPGATVQKTLTQQRKSYGMPATSQQHHNAEGGDTLVRKSMGLLPVNEKTTSSTITTAANGNYSLSSATHITSDDFLDNEQFHDETLPDDEDVSDHYQGKYDSNNNHSSSNIAHKTMSLKLPAVRKQLSNLSIQSHVSKSGASPASSKLTSPASRRFGVAATPAASGAHRKLEPIKKTTPIAVKNPKSNAIGRPTVTKSSAVANVAVPIDQQIGQSNSSSMASLETGRKSAASSTTIQSARSINAGKNTLSPDGSATPRTANSTTPADGTQTSCRICGRHFNPDRLDKHEAICQKTAQKKRKIFDATTHRIKGTDAESFVKKQLRSQRITVPTKGPAITAAAVAKLVATSSPPPKRSDWRRKHEEFISAIRSAKQVQAHLARGGKLSDLPPPPPSENPDYVQCPHCQRRFNETAAQRHIPKCATFQHNKPKMNAARTSKKF